MYNKEREWNKINHFKINHFPQRGKSQDNNPEQTGTIHTYICSQSI